MRMTPYRGLLVCALLMEAGFLGIRSLDNLADRVVEFVGLYLLVFLLYLLGCFWSTHQRHSAEPAERPSSRRLLVLIWSAGIVFRVTLLSMQPALSDDLNRYRWHGKLQAAGGNPYVEVPASPRWEELRDGTWPHINRKDLPSVYGPLLELVYAGWYRVVAFVSSDEFTQTWLFKLPFAALELAAGLALVPLLKAVGAPASALLIYLWSPLMIVEFWAQGHNDPLALLLTLLALGSAYRGRWRWAFSWLTLAALAKFWPAILFPFFLVARRCEGWVFRWKPALVAVPIAAVLVWPYWPGIVDVSELLKGFAGGWRNNDSLYTLIFHYAGESYDRGTELVALVLAVALGGLWAARLPLAKAAKWAVALVLLLSANCFPWYLSWLVPFLALYPGVPLILWTGLVVLAYHVLIGYQALGIWQYHDDMSLLEYLPVYGLLAGRWIVTSVIRRRNRPPLARR